MAHVALYRKYRSQTFGDLVGQEHVVRTLKNAVATERIGHAYLFTGPRGTGKTSSARLLAKALNCPSVKEGEPCGTCDICTSIADGSAMDVTEIDAASESGVDDVRESIVQAVEYKPAICRYRVFIIDEVHDLSSKAFDALLKTIEEPPSHIVFVLATTEFSKVPATIRSRCQRFEFHRGSLATLTQRLEHVAREEAIEYEPAALAAIAKMADGGYRDSLTLFEQAVLTAEGKVTLDHVYNQLGLISDDLSDKVIGAIASGDAPALMGLTESVYQTGRDPRSILEALLYRLSDLTRAHYRIDSGGAGADAAAEAALAAQAQKLSPEVMLKIRSGVAEAHRVIRDVSLPRLWLEAELIRISQSLQAAPVVQAAAAAAASASQPRPAPSSRSTAQAPAQASAPSSRAADPPQEAPKHKAAATPEEAAWQRVLGSFAGSPTAKNKLASTRVGQAVDGVVTVLFERLVDYDRFMESGKLRSAVIAQWQQESPGLTLVFAAAGDGLNMRVVPEVTAVELPLEGDRLAQAAREVFLPEQK